MNRIDEIVVFEPLTREQIGAIVDIQIRLLAKRLAERSLGLELTEAARELIAARGYDPAFGARPLKRIIQREIQDPLAVKLLSGEIGEGDTVLVDADGGVPDVQGRLHPGPPGPSPTDRPRSSWVDRRIRQHSGRSEVGGERVGSSPCEAEG